MLNYILTHWRGQQGLARSLLLNGLVGFFIVSILAVAAQSAMLFGLVVLLVYEIWAVVGIVRTGIRYLFNKSGTVISRAAGGATVVLMALVVYYTIQDLNHVPILNLLKLRSS